MRKILLFIVLLMSAVAFSASAPQPESMPYCQSPQQLSPPQLMGEGAVYDPPPVVWNGKEFAAVWIDALNDKLVFMKFYADGTPASARVEIFDTFSSYSPALVWNGSGYAVAYVNYDEALEWEQVYFARLDADGTPIGSAVRVSSYGVPAASNAGYPTMAWSGNGYAVSYVDDKSGNYQIYAALLDAAGNVQYHDTRIEATAYYQDSPAIAWIPGRSVYQVVWLDYRNGSTLAIHGGQITPTNYVMELRQLVSGSSNSVQVSLVNSLNTCGMTWGDYRDGNLEIYFAILNAYGAKATSDIRVTNNAYADYYPQCRWTGVEYGIFWYGIQSSYLMNMAYQRISSAGTLQGTSAQVSGMTELVYPNAAFASHGYLVACIDDMGSGVFTIPFGCNYADIPGCPSNLLAYGVSGSTATIAWQPAIDNYTDIAYYAVYRNNTQIAKTSNTYFTDTGLGLNTTYNYTVRAVNASQYMNDPQTCSSSQPQSVYVKTNASFTLMLDKSSDPDAHLYWSDGGMNSYNIYRGTSPQVMSLIGTTSGQSADDNNVLLETNTYFYTVDDPGQ